MAGGKAFGEAQRDFFLCNGGNCAGCKNRRSKSDPLVQTNDHEFLSRWLSCQ
jgi:hypothetical protein